MVTGPLAGRWQRLSTRGKVVTVVLLSLPFVAAAVSFMANSDGITLVDPDNAAVSYVSVFVLIFLDAVMPIFPGETTLNAAATLAAQGQARPPPDHRHGGAGGDPG